MILSKEFLIIACWVSALAWLVVAIAYAAKRLILTEQKETQIPVNLVWTLQQVASKNCYKGQLEHIRVIAKRLSKVIEG